MTLQNLFGDLALDVTLQDVKRGLSDTDQRFEWQSVNGEDKPLYIGIAVHGTSVSDTVWSIQKYTFDVGPAGSYVPTLIQTAVGAWSQRETLFA